MKYCITLLLAGLLLMPEGASAQYREPFPRARISVAPVLGLRFPYTTQYEAAVYTFDAEEVSVFREERGGGEMAGGELEVHLIGPISLIGSVFYAPPGENLVSQDGDTPQMYSGPNTWFGSAGLSIRLPEPTPDYRRFPLVASLTLAGAVVREIPQASPLPPNHPRYVPNAWRAINHPAANLGFKAITLLGTEHLAFQFGVNDFITFWNAREMKAQLEEAYRDLLGLDVIADYQLGHSHLFQAYVGFSLRL